MSGRKPTVNAPKTVVADVGLEVDRALVLGGAWTGRSAGSTAHSALPLLVAIALALWATLPALLTTAHSALPFLPALPLLFLVALVLIALAALLVALIVLIIHLNTPWSWPPKEKWTRRKLGPRIEDPARRGA